MMANKLGVPTVVQEQNSYAGVTNKKSWGKGSKNMCRL
jgi:UDP-N-acetylglucosamine--N-acetylmuramyl-(pentapeptide) pyrophosphoryl-undecaprenol N-acetylglucosamine transferase